MDVYKPFLDIVSFRFQLEFSEFLKNKEILSLSVHKSGNKNLSKASLLI